MNRHTRSAGLAGILVLLGQCIAIPVARADDDPAALLLRAFDLRREHRNEEALVLCRKAFAISQTGAVRAQLGLAEQSLGHWLDAAQDLDIALASDDPWVARNRESLQKANDAMAPHLAWLLVEVDIANTDIVLDGVTLRPGIPSRVVAGEAMLVVRAPGFIPDMRRVSLAPQEHVTQRIAMAPLVPSPPPTEASIAPLPPENPPPAVIAPPESARLPVVPIALGALAVAGIATGTYFGIRSLDAKHDETLHCANGCTSAAASDYSNAQTSASVSTIAFVGAGAFAATGAFLWFLERKDTRPAVTVAPAMGLDTRGLVVRGAF